MSIKFSELTDLKTNFLSNSPIVKKINEEILGLTVDIKKIITEDALKGCTEEDIEVLRKYEGYLVEKTINLGYCFRHDYYRNKDAKPVNPRFSVFGRVQVPRNYLPSNLTTLGLDFTRSKILKKIIPLNDKIIDLQERKQEIYENFDRFINERTSLVWLKNNLPKVYERLKTSPV